MTHEDFRLQMPQSPEYLIKGNIGKAFLALLISFFLLTGTIKGFGIRGVVLVITLAVIVFIIIEGARGSGVALSLPATTYPFPPHLGHSGVSLSMEEAGTNTF